MARMDMDCDMDFDNASGCQLFKDSSLAPEMCYLPYPFSETQTFCPETDYTSKVERPGNSPFYSSSTINTNEKVSQSHLVSRMSIHRPVMSNYDFCSREQLGILLVHLDELVAWL